MDVMHLHCISPWTAQPHVAALPSSRTSHIYDNARSQRFNTTAPAYTDFGCCSTWQKQSSLSGILKRGSVPCSAQPGFVHGHSSFVRLFLVCSMHRSSFPLSNVFCFLSGRIAVLQLSLNMANRLWAYTPWYAGLVTPVTSIPGHSRHYREKPERLAKELDTDTK